MSIAKYSRKDFLSIKKLPKSFRFMVDNWKEQETQFGKGIFLVGEVLQTPTELKQHGPKKGQLRLSPTTALTLEKLGLREWDQLVQNTIHFEWDDDIGTIKATDVQKWTGDSITNTETEETKKPTKAE